MEETYCRVLVPMQPSLMPLFVTLWILLAIPLGVCFSEDLRPILLVSVTPYQKIVQEMIGPEAEVRSVVPSGANCHSFDPPPSQIQSMQKAVLWFTIGESFEEKMLKSIHPTFVADLREGLTCEDSHQKCHMCGKKDVHIWINPKMMRTQLATIRTWLVTTFPHSQSAIEERYRLLLNKLEKIISQVDLLLSTTARKALIISHGAYGYLCKEYGIEQLAIEEGGKEATVSSVDALIQRAKKDQITTVFAVAQSPRKGIDRIAKIIGAHVIELNPYNADYFSEQLSTAQAFHLALETP